MGRFVVGIVGNFNLINDEYPAYAAGKMNCDALSKVSKVIPIILPSSPEFTTVEELISICDGFLFTGGRPNVHPSNYGVKETVAHGDFDRDRDALTLPLIKRAVSIGIPIFGICRGFQEVAVAMGATLHPEIRDLDGRMNHRMPPDGTLEEKFAIRHPVNFRNDGNFSKILGSTRIETNTLHGQGIAEVGNRLVIDGWASDGTPEALYVKDAAGYTNSVQWHPEWNAENDLVSKLLFEAFGDAVRDYGKAK